MTASALEVLIDYVIDATKVFRKGEVISVTDRAVVVDAFEATPLNQVVVDCHFVNVGFTRHASTWCSEKFRDMSIRAANEGVITDIELSKGPSYITLGGWLGSQTLAFQFMALGVYHELWTVITPAALHVTGEQADRLAGLGMVMISGLKEQEVTNMRGRP